MVQPVSSFYTLLIYARESGFSSKKVWVFMSAMQNNFYCIRLHTTFTGDEYLASCIATVILKEKPAPLNFTA